MGEKYCIRCDRIKDCTEFYNDKKSKDGRAFYCKACSNLFKTEAHARRKANGRCDRCNSVKLPTHSMCMWHFFYYGAQKHIENSVCSASHMMDLWVKQGMRCPYTGEVLVPGDNLSFDHILPSSRFPEIASDISNIQLVTRRINILKGDLTHEEFISMCTGVARRFNK